MADIIIGAIISGVLSAITYTVSALLAPKAESFAPSTNAADRLRDIRRDGTAPARIVYGTRGGLSGVLAYAQSCDRDGQKVRKGPYLHVLLLFTEGPVVDIKDVIFNDERADSDRYRGRVLFISRTGYRDQPPMPTAARLGTIDLDLPEEWTAKPRPMRHIGYLWGILAHKQDVFPGGAPTIRATVVGRLVYDPREDVTLGGSQQFADENTWTYSDNWALCILEYMTNRRYGMGIPLASVDLDSVIAAANVADELVDTSEPVDTNDLSKGYKTQKRYAINGLIESDQPPLDVLASMLAAGAGALVYVDGKYVLKAGTTESASLDLDEDDLRDDADIVIVPKPGRRERINTIKGTFMNAAKNWIGDAFPPVTNTTYLKEDGNTPLVSELDLPFTTDVDMARRLAMIQLKTSRQSIRLKWPCKPVGIRVLPWSVIRITHAQFGWTTKEFRVLDATILGDTGGIDLDLLEYDPDVYEFHDSNGVPFGDQPAVDRTPPTELPDPFLLTPPLGVTAAEDTVVNPDGARLSVLNITVAPPTDSLPDRYLLRVSEVVVRGVADADLRVTSYVLEQPVLTRQLVGLRAGTYRIEAASVQRERISAFVSTLVDVTYRTQSPPNCTNLRVEALDNGMRFITWSLDAASEPPDLAGYEIRFLEGAWGINLDAEWTTATRISRVTERTPGGVPDAMRYHTRTPRRPGTYTIYVKAYDTYGDASDDPAYVVVRIPEPTERNVLTVEEASERRWPGLIDGGDVNPVLNTLEPFDPTTWDEVPTTWDAWDYWISNPRTLRYIHTPITWETARDVVASLNIEATGDPQLDRWASFRTGDTWNQLQQRLAYDGANGVYAGFVADRQTTSGPPPIIHAFEIVVRAEREQEIVNDYSIAAQTVIGGRVRFRLPAWKTGTHQNTRIVQVSGEQYGLEIANKPMLEMTAASNYISVIDNPNLRVRDAFTIQFLYRSDTTQQNCVVLAKGTDYEIRYGYGAAAGQWYLFSTGYGGADPSSVKATMPINDDWPLRLVTFTYDGEFLSIYFDAALQTRGRVAFTLPQSSAALRLNGRADGTQRFTGILADVRIWNRGLSAAEVALCTNGAFSLPGLVGYWPIDDGAGASIADYAIEAYDGLLAGGPTWVRCATWVDEDLPLDIIGNLSAIAFGHDRTTNAAWSATQQVSVDGGLNWQSLSSPGNTPVTGLTAGAAQDGVVLRSRMKLRSSNVATTPRVTVAGQLWANSNTPADWSYYTRTDFSSIDEAMITAQQAFSTPAVPQLVARSRYGVRWKMYAAATGAALAVSDTGMVDMALRGPALEGRTPLGLS